MCSAIVLANILSLPREPDGGGRETYDDLGIPLLDFAVVVPVYAFQCGVAGLAVSWDHADG